MVEFDWKLVKWPVFEKSKIHVLTHSALMSLVEEWIRDIWAIKRDRMKCVCVRVFRICSPFGFSKYLPLIFRFDLIWSMGTNMVKSEQRKFSVFIVIGWDYLGCIKYLILSTRLYFAIRFFSILCVRSMTFCHKNISLYLCEYECTLYMERKTRSYLINFYNNINVPNRYSFSDLQSALVVIFKLNPSLTLTP